MKLDQLIKWGIAALVGYYIYTTYFAAQTVPAAVIAPTTETPSDVEIANTPEIETPQIPAADSVDVDAGDVVETTDGESFTVIQGGGIPSGGLAGIFRNGGISPEGFESAVPRAFGSLLEDRTTNLAMDIEGQDPLM